ncbi:MAG: ROK family transcriptional regulator [Oscillibacter sp.]|nr:ROK family transcriptional regulator [Oscillibacter sp.]
MDTRKGMNNDTLRSRNRGLILKLLATEGALSRVELARRTGLSKMSVSNIIAEFDGRGYVEVHEVVSAAGAGRNPVALRLSDAAPKLIGLFVFRDECAAILCDMRLNALREARAAVNAANAANLADILFSLIDSVYPENETPLGIGVGSIGPIDLRRGVILDAPRFHGIHDFPIAKLLRERYRLPVRLDGQYACAALAEKYFGAARGYRDFIFVGITSGIGAGVVSHGELLRSAAGFSSELGHMSIDWRGNLCACGNRGCLETYAGLQVILPRLRRECGRPEAPFEVFCREAGRDGASAAWGALNAMTRALAAGLTSAANLLDPQAIVIGDSGAHLPDSCLAALEAEITRRRAAKRPVKVLRSAFGAEAAVRGCACGLLDAVFRGEFFR